MCSGHLSSHQCKMRVVKKLSRSLVESVKCVVQLEWVGNGNACTLLLVFCNKLYALTFAGILLPIVCMHFVCWDFVTICMHFVCCDFGTDCMHFVCWDFVAVCMHIICWDFLTVCMH